MNRFGHNQELRELVAQLCDGDLTPEQAARLEQLAIADPAARRYYITYLDLHGTLRRYLTAETSTPETSADKAVNIHPPIVSAESGPLDAIPHDENYTVRSTPHAIERRQSRAAAAASSVQNGWSNGATTQTRLESSCGAPRRPWRAKLGGVAEQLFLHPLLASVIASAVMLLSVFAAIVVNWGPMPKQGEASLASIDPFQVVAEVTRTHAAWWTSPRSTPKDQKYLYVGQQIDLTAGFVEFKLKNGVQVLLEGPAVLRLDGDNRGALSRGRLTARVPPKAAGFAVHTPSALVTNQPSQWQMNSTLLFATQVIPASAAEFGVDVTENRTTDIQVFEGRADIEVRNGLGELPGSVNGRRLALLADDSASVTPAGDVKLSSGATEQPRFVREVPQANRVPGLIAHYDFEALSVDFVPDMAGGRVNHTMKNSSNATIRITQSEDRRQGKHSGSFAGPDGQSNACFRVIAADDPLRTGTLTIAFWMKFDGRNADWMMPVTWDDCNHPEDPDSKGINTPWSVQINRKTEGEARTLRFIVGVRALDYAGGANSDDVPVPADRWVHVAIVHTDITTKIYLDGNRTPAAESETAGISVKSTEHLRLGSRGGCYPYQGLLDDVRIYNLALSPEEIALLYKQSAR